MSFQHYLCVDYRLAVLVTVSTCVFLGAYYIPSVFGTVLLSAAFGYLLSTDLSLLCSQLVQACRSHNKVSTHSQFLKDSKQVQPNSGFGWTWGVTTLLYHAAMLAVVIGVAAGVNYNSADLNWKACGWVVVGLCVAEKCSRDMQGVYVFLGLFRNYFFPHSCHHKNRPFVTTKRRLAVLGVIRRIIFNWGESTLSVFRYTTISESACYREGLYTQATNNTKM